MGRPNRDNASSTHRWAMTRGEAEDHVASDERRGMVLLSSRTARLVRFIRRVRSLRNGFFDEALFGDPAWDILISLYEAELYFRNLGVNAVAMRARIPLTTGLRWLKALEDRGYICRTPDPVDARRIFISLSAEGAYAMARFLAAFEDELTDLQAPRTEA